LENDTKFLIYVKLYCSSSAFEKNRDSLREFGEFVSNWEPSQDKEREIEPIGGDLDRASV
jgi:hypothetical protein